MDLGDGDGEGGIFLEILGINELGRVGNGSMHHAPPVRLVFLEMLESSQSNPIQSGQNERTNEQPSVFEAQRTFVVEAAQVKTP